MHDIIMMFPRNNKKKKQVDDDDLLYYETLPKQLVLPFVVVVAYDLVVPYSDPKFPFVATTNPLV